MEIKVQSQDNQPTVIVLSGSLDASATKEARAVFSSLLDEGVRNFVIDLGNVDFIDSSGIGVLVGFFKRVRIGEGQLDLARVRRPIMKIFELTQLDKVFTYVDLPDAPQ